MRFVNPVRPILAAAVAAMPVAMAFEVNVLELGAEADGSADNTAVFQKALDQAAEAGGGVVRVPSGRFRIDGVLTVGEGVALVGTHQCPPTAHGTAPERLLGSVLLAYAGRGEPASPAFITLKGTAAALKGVIVAYPEWRREDVPPMAYPPTVAAGRVDNVAVLDCLLLNSYEGIHFDGTGRFLVRNVYGYPSARGIYVNRCLDIGRIENVHFWPFGVAYRPEEPYSRWINLNGVAFDLAKTDWQIVSNSFCFGYGVGYRFRRSDDGVFCGKLVASSADCCQTPVKVEANGHILISEGEFVGRWGSRDAVCVDIGPESTGKVSLMNCAFWGPIFQVVRTRAPAGSVSVIGCDIRNWDGDAGAIQIDAGKAIIQANTFTRPGLNVRLGQDVVSAIVTGNQAEPGLRVENGAGARAVIANNQEDPFRWPSESAKAAYLIDVGHPGDFRYVRDWNDCERAGEWGGEGSKRWSKADSRVVLPILPGRTYRVAVDAYVPPFALAEDAGLYVDDTCVAPITKAGHARLAGALPATDADAAVLHIRCRGWHPFEETEGSRDRRELGIGVRGIEVRATDVDDATPLFNACAGQ